jgi:hypothetical protein
MHNEEIKDLPYLPNIIRMKKSKRLRGTGHVAVTWERKYIRGFGVVEEGGGGPEGTSYSGDQGVDETLKWILTFWHRIFTFKF